MLLRDGMGRYGIIQVFNINTKRYHREVKFAYSNDELLEKTKKEHGTLIRVVPFPDVKRA